MDEVGNIVQSFYNTTPFPDYELENFEDKEDLKLAAGEFAEIIDRSIPANASVIDVGTGTGQLSGYLSLRRKVWGIDFSDTSLNKAKALKKKLGLDNWTLRKVDLLSKEQMQALPKFDYVLCLGVLHHTSQPYQGFQNVVDLLKPEGYIAIGLYNKFGRMKLKHRQAVARRTKNIEKMKQEFVKRQLGETEDKEKIRGWWNDQYLHPHESCHTIGEVMDWFEKNRIQYLHTVPFTEFNKVSNVSISGVWLEKGEPGLIERALTQLKWIWETDREGGYWITFGKKRTQETQ
jgi:SAM-dependent methyltransferase